MPGSPHEALLLLEDGSLFVGRAVSAGTRFGEVVFNTSMTGYQEVLTDPSYRGQIVVMTQPHIGNYGVSGLDEESERPWVEGFIARQFTAQPSSFGAEGDLPGYLRRHGVPAIDGIDTRALVRRLRQHGSLRGVVTTERSGLDRLRAELADFPSMAGRALVDDVTRERPSVVAAVGSGPPRARLAVYDFGVKANILRSLAAHGVELEVLPARTPARRVIESGVDGVVLSNGPGDPEPLTEVIANVRELIDAGLPLFGICLGHQLLSLALGGRTYKLKFGHRGLNQPVKDLTTGRVEITTQNHGFVVDIDSLKGHARSTHVHLNDGTSEGLEAPEARAFSVQYHPEAAAGPHDALYLFERFRQLVAG